MSDQQNSSIFSENEVKIDEIFNALAAPRRLRELLVIARNPGIKFEVLQRHMGISASLISRDLGSLTKAKIIFVVPSGNNRFAFCNLETIKFIESLFTNLLSEVSESYAKGLGPSSDKTPEDSPDGEVGQR